jgi:hypothetical protein
MMCAKKLSRRDFLTTGTGAAAAGLLAGGARPAEGETDKPRGRVVLVRDPKVLGAEREPDPTILHDMLNRGVASLFEEKDSAAAWRRLISPSDVVGIKSNVWGYLPTPPALEEAIRKETLRVGVKAQDISVDDRGVRTNPVFKRATAIINTRPLRTHDWSGLGTCIKNLITFTERYPDYHGDACAPLGSIWLRPEIKGKVRLNVLVMLTPQFHSTGPHSFSQKFLWPYAGLILGVDPVAVDATGARIIEAKRKLYFGDDRPMRPPPHHIQIAETQYGIGVADPERIEIVRLGWKEDSLI